MSNIDEEAKNNFTIEMRIEPLLEGGDRIWMEELEMYYLFFYEIRNNRRVLGKNRVKKILDILL